MVSEAEMLKLLKLLREATIQNNKFSKRKLLILTFDKAFQGNGLNQTCQSINGVD